ncbi:MAG: class I SAM-dependent methyltransferase [Brevinematales bacterium]|nr:class I SAM-dependent methyltransferase [Brevinematales bacterium]
MFYDDVSDFYDDMTGYNEELELTRAAIEGFIKKYPASNLLDSACGTGIYAIAAAKTGIKATGADLSENMIAKAKINSARENVPVKWLTGDIRELNAAETGKFDMILCMGNSLPHFLSTDDLRDAFGVWKSLLNPGGVLVVEFLNYTKILERKERVIYIDKKNKREYIRFYDFIDDRSLMFNILEVEWADVKAGHRLFSMELHPYQYEEVVGIAEETGFIIDGIFTDLSCTQFDSRKSGIVLIVCKIS